MRVKYTRPQRMVSGYFRVWFFVEPLFTGWKLYKKPKRDDIVQDALQFGRDVKRYQRDPDGYDGCTR